MRSNRIMQMSEMPESGYEAWLRCKPVDNVLIGQYAPWFRHIVMPERSVIMQSAGEELVRGIASMLGFEPKMSEPGTDEVKRLLAGTFDRGEIQELVGPDMRNRVMEDGYVLMTADRPEGSCLVLAGRTDKGVLYAAFHLLRLIRTEQSLDGLAIVENPANGLRLINQWDNMDGSIERGYAGKSIFYEDNRFVPDMTRIRDYARLLASTGVNGIVLNNVNVHKHETMLITETNLPEVAKAAGVFRAYGIRTFLSINFASPIQIGGLATADPLDEAVRSWWVDRASDIYRHIPDFGGFLVKADSEFRPGPFTYGRNHDDGANMLADALLPHGGLVIWRCFVYNCLQDWRDRTTDRARAAYDHFTPLDGRFNDNVILQIKKGPMDFQVREPVSPLFGGLTETNQMLELQITQEYTGQQRHLCYLVPQWKEVIAFDTYAQGEGTTVADIACGQSFGRPYGGFAAVSNIGADTNWTGHLLAQANLYGFGRLAWSPSLGAEDIAREWAAMTFGVHPDVVRTICGMLLSSWRIYENYTAPLGIGWMVNPNHHYGPNVDGYEYSKWGTYHFADSRGIGVDRTLRSGTGYTGQYHEPQRSRFESLEECPDELLLFFHHVPYTHVLKSGKTVIQHIYDTHFEGVEQAAGLVETWLQLEGKVDCERFGQVLKRLQEQAEHAKEWRDVINTYFFRKSGIPDAKGRRIY